MTVPEKEINLDERFAYRTQTMSVTACDVTVSDSTTIALVTNCMPWARHRRRKTAAKCHLRLELQNLLPACAIVDGASHDGDPKARDLCAGLQDEEQKERNSLLT